MEKVFASVLSPLEISVAVARTSQSPFPLAVTISEKPQQIAENRRMDYDLENLRKYFDYTSEQKNENFISDETSQDLELEFVFIKLDSTFSKIGKQYFYSKFRTFENSENEFEEYKNHFTKNENDKHFVIKQLSNINNKKDFEIIDLLREEISTNEKYYKYAQFSIISVFLIVICSFFVQKVLLILIPFFVGNLIVHYLNKNYVDYYNGIIFRLQNSLAIAKKVSKITALKTQYEKINLTKIEKNIRFANFESAIVTNEYLSVLWILTEIFRVAFVLEIFSFRKKVKILKSSKSELLKVFEFIGKVDTSITLLNIQEKYKTCKPNFVNNKQINFQNIYHPFIENCVKNSLELDNKSIIITGSNMSGKTSFVRNIAINVLFAQNFGFCFADSFSAPKMKIFSSISIHDDTSENKSYYLEEVLRIKTFLEDRNDFALILIDEIFKGTNTKERIAISKAVLENLNNEKNIVFVTTHDLEIAQFLKNKNYELYYFDEEVDKNHLSFPYKLKLGINNKTNAIKILEMYNYSEKIIENAKKLVENNGYS